MKKLLILFIVLFLSSCSRGEVEMIDVYFTQGGTLPNSETYASKFSNFADYSYALDNGLESDISEYSDDFDDEFFIEHDLIIVLFYSDSGLDCGDFRLNPVRIDNNQLNVTITSLVVYGSLDPQPTISKLYGYLIVIDKTEIVDVELIFD